MTPGLRGGKGETSLCAARPVAYGKQKNPNPTTKMPNTQNLQDQNFPPWHKAELHIIMVQEFKTCAELPNCQWALWREPQ